MKFYLLAALSLSQLAATAQSETAQKGTVIYEQTIQLRRNMVGLDPAIAERIPQTRTQQYELLYNTESSLFRRVEEDEVNGGGGDGGGGGPRVMFRNGPGIGGGGDLYRNLKTGLMIQENEVGDDTYLVMDTASRRVGNLSYMTDSLRSTFGKLRLQPDSVRTIAGYKCQRASISTQLRAMSAAQQAKMRQEMEAQRANGGGGGFRMNFGGPGGMQGDSLYSSETVYWYTTQIPVQAGPASFGNLPGLVMEVNADNGRTVYRAVEVNANVREKDLKEPSKGKRLSNVEFREKMREFGERMRQMGGPGGGRRMQQF